MANLRAIRTRIKSVQSTQKITKAMKMVAAARLRRSQNRVTHGRPYQEAIRDMLLDMGKGVEPMVHPLLESREVKKRLVVVFSSDRGLCGAFNSGLFRFLRTELHQDGVDTSVFAIGRKAISQYKAPLGAEHDETFWNEFSYDKTLGLFDRLKDLFLSGEYDEIYLAYNTFKSVIAQIPTMQRLLPFVPDVDDAQGDDASVASTDYLLEPDRQSLIDALVPRAAQTQLYAAAANSLASEFGARMTAMDSATRNAGEMIDTLTLNMNRARQAAITNELVEIISGAAAIG